MHILLEAIYSDIHFHFHNTTFTRTIARRNMSKQTFSKLSKTFLVLNTVFQIKIQSMNALDVVVLLNLMIPIDLKSRSISIIRFRRVTRSRALRQDLYIFWRVFFFSTIITNTENNGNKTFDISLYSLFWEFTGCQKVEANVALQCIF